MDGNQPAEPGSASSPTPEPWLRGTLTEIAPVPRAVLHAMELAREDLQKWCGALTEAELNARPADLPSVAFHLRHIARSLDRLLTYAEGRALTREQRSALHEEMSASGNRDALFAELASALTQSAERVRAIALADLEQSRTVGEKRLPTTIGGLLVHVADHTQRHVGQAVTTAKILLAKRA
jgi:uncharacterized damage-inducible protein DinB